MSYIDRRTFLASTAAAGVVAAAKPLSAGAPDMLIPQGVKPIVVASANGHRYKHGGSKTGVEVAPIEGGARNLPLVLEELKRREIQSVLVEGGTGVAGTFIDTRLVDKVTLIYSPMIIGGSDAPVAIGGKGAADLSEALRLIDIEVTRHGNDIEVTGYPAKSE